MLDLFLFPHATLLHLSLSSFKTPFSFLHLSSLYFSFFSLFTFPSLLHLSFLLFSIQSSLRHERGGHSRAVCQGAALPHTRQRLQHQVNTSVLVPILALVLVPILVLVLVPILVLVLVPILVLVLVPVLYVYLVKAVALISTVRVFYFSL